MNAPGATLPCRVSRSRPSIPGSAPATPATPGLASECCPRPSLSAQWDEHDRGLLWLIPLDAPPQGPSAHRLCAAHPLDVDPVGLAAQQLADPEQAAVGGGLGMADDATGRNPVTARRPAPDQGDGCLGVGAGRQVPSQPVAAGLEALPDQSLAMRRVVMVARRRRPGCECSTRSVLPHIRSNMAATWLSGSGVGLKVGHIPSGDDGTKASSDTAPVEDAGAVKKQSGGGGQHVGQREVL